jgi:predicted O-methyltransferase YrrM
MLAGSLIPVAKVDVSFFGADPKSDISEHLNLLYLYLCSAKPLEILELGTRGGESTKVLEKYCSEMKIVGRSIDLDPEPYWLAKSHSWKHFVGDDISIGKSLNSTGKWPDNKNFSGLDFILVDTSHEYSHTLLELETYVPLLNNATGAIAFHDSNLTSSPTRRLDGSLGYGWDNQRGVARAIEDYFQIKFCENSLQVQLIAKKMIFYHQPWCNGFSIILPHPDRR